MILIYVLAGIFAGLLAVLFGFGGGFVVVPLLVALLPLQNVPGELTMHIAVGSSLMLVLLNMLYATWLHYLKQNIEFMLLKQMLAFVALGAIAGALIANALNAQYLKYVFLLLVACILLQTLKREFFKKKQVTTLTKPGKALLAIVGFITGTIASLLGVGGSVIIVPFFRRYSLPMIRASALANALALPSSLIGSIIFAVAGWEVVNLPRFSTGYIFWPAVFSIFIGCTLGSRIGIRLSMIMPDSIYGKIYVLLLMIIIASMLLKL